MSLFSKEELQELIDYRADPCVSIYLPTYRVGSEIQQNPIHLKDLLDQAEDQLTQRGIRSPQLREILAPGRALVDRAENWRFQNDGLALFYAPGFSQEYRLPRHFTDLVQVNNRFYVKPLIPLLGGDGTFYILALSQNKVRLLRGDRETVKEIDLKDLPHSLAEALSTTVYQEQQGFHTDTQNPGGVQGERPAMFYGHGNAKDAEKTELLKYFRKIDHGVTDYLESKGDPLVLAGVAYLHPIYRQANTYNQLVSEGLEGSPDTLDARQLHERAWKIVQPLFEQTRRTDRKRYDDLSRTNLTSTDPQEIIPAAYYGRVDALFVANDYQRWGKFDPSNGQLVLHNSQHDGDEDLTDSAAVQSWENNGRVYVTEPSEMPNGTRIAAIFRYQLQS